MKTNLKRIYLILSALLLTTLSAGAVTFDWALIGNTDNLSDIQTGYGAVGYDYRIATTQVTNAQYIEFLNAVAKTDTYGLYNTDMGSTYGGITRSGSDGSYFYSLKNDDSEWANRPVVYVTWYDALRFINWLHNGQLTASQDNTTTEYGVYDLLLQNTDPISIVRLEGADYWLPSEDEWYKAAYYDPVAEVYYNYATSSDDVPVAGVDANYDRVEDSPYYTTPVGYYDNDSPYGTYDQSGNVWEWNEELISGQYRCLRGGSWRHDASYLPASHRNYGATEDGYNNIGFRVASYYSVEDSEIIPEPVSLGLVLLSLSALVIRRSKDF